MMIFQWRNGACNSIVPLDSESCPECGISFSGVAEEQLGECGACSAIIPIDSESCPECGASFVEHPDIEYTSDDMADDSTDEITEEVSPVEDISQQQTDAPELDTVLQEVSVVSSTVQVTEPEEEAESIPAAPSIDELIESDTSDELEEEDVSVTMVSTASQTAVIDQVEEDSTSMPEKR